MGDPIVIELQRLSSDRSHDIGDLLRKSLIVATKLRIDDFTSWINSELNGYEKRDAVPEYRRIPTQLKAVNRWRGGLDPMLIDDPEMAELFLRVPLMQPIAELQSLASAEGGTFQMTMHGGELGIIWKYFGLEEPLEIIRIGSRISVVAIVSVGAQNRPAMGA